MNDSEQSSFKPCESPSGMIIKILWRQQQELLNKYPDGVSILINSEDPLDIQANIQGPKGTPYEAGLFRVKIQITSEFPQVAPKGYFMTKIYHPNVSEKGEICVNTLKKDWNPKMWSLYNVLEVIKCLLIVPFPESSLNEEAGKLFMENYQQYYTIAAIYTSVHAKTSGQNSPCPDESEKYVSPVFNTSLYNQQNYSNTNNYFGDCESKIMDFSILSRHSKSVSYKNQPPLQKHSFNYTSSLKRKYSQINNVDLSQKLNINNLPFVRSNSFSSNLENENMSQQNVNNQSNFNNVLLSTMNQTPKSKKEELKKWLSRI